MSGIRVCVWKFFNDKNLFKRNGNSLWIHKNFKIQFVKIISSKIFGERERERERERVGGRETDRQTLRQTERNIYIVNQSHNIFVLMFTYKCNSSKKKNNRKVGFFLNNHDCFFSYIVILQVRVYAVLNSISQTFRLSIFIKIVHAV